MMSTPHHPPLAGTDADGLADDRSFDEHQVGGEEARLPMMNRHDRCDQLLVWDDRVRAHSEE